MTLGPNDQNGGGGVDYLGFAGVNLHRGEDGKEATPSALRTMIGFLGAMGADVQDDGGIALIFPATSPEDRPVAYKVSPTGDIVQSVFAVHYTSTACVHDEHVHCRVSCRWCDETCRCICHGEGGITPPPPDYADQLVAEAERRSP